MRTGRKLREFTHPSAVTGLAFDAKGKRIGASHYNGATLWFVAAKTDSPRKLEWKGSHTGFAIHPDGDAVVTAMQENALHGWRLSDGQHMRMSGYPSKTTALSFTRNGKWLASSGADAMVLWPFFGGGPMGKAPLELAGGDGILCTQVACHPQQEMVAGGFADGLVVMADVAILARPAGGAAGAWAGLRAGLEPGRRAAGVRHRARVRRDHRSVGALTERPPGMIAVRCDRRCCRIGPHALRHDCTT